MKQSLSSDSFIERIFIGIFPDSMPPAARKAHSAWRFARSPLQKLLIIFLPNQNLQSGYWLVYNRGLNKLKGC
jgi:hypothetical protein